jgi:hypothetical protein
MLRHKTLKVLDGNGLVVLASSTSCLAGVMADPTADAWEGDGFADQSQGFGEFALGDERHVALDVDAGRAGRCAGRRPAFLNGENARHCVVGLVDSSVSV